MLLPNQTSLYSIALSSPLNKPQPTPDNGHHTGNTHKPDVQTPTAENNSTATREPVDLKAIQEEIKQNLQLDLKSMVEQLLQPFQNNMNHSMAKLDTRYDELTHTVKLLQQEVQHLINQFKDIKTILPSLTKQGDGRS